MGDSAQAALRLGRRRAVGGGARETKREIERKRTLLVQWERGLVTSRQEGESDLGFEEWVKKRKEEEVDLS